MLPRQRISPELLRAEELTNSIRIDVSRALRAAVKAEGHAYTRYELPLHSAEDLGLRRGGPCLRAVAVTALAVGLPILIVEAGPGGRPLTDGRVSAQRRVRLYRLGIEQGVPEAPDVPRFTVAQA